MKNLVNQTKYSSKLEKFVFKNIEYDRTKPYYLVITDEETGIELDSNKLILIDTLSGESRKNSYPNGDIVYNNTSLYLADITNNYKLKGDSETKRLEFFNTNDVPENLMDKDLIQAYICYSTKKIK